MEIILNHLNEFTGTIIKYVNDRRYCMSIFMELKIDTVDQGILLDKIARYVIREHNDD